MQLVSVIIPVYNAEQYITATVQSVLAQTYSNIELLIVNDGSSDRSIEICQEFQDNRIRILQQQNRGPSAARNLGIRHATGEFIAFLDADDLWLPEKLEKHIDHLNQSPEVGISFSRSAFIDSNNHPIHYYQMPKLTGITTAHLFCRNPISNGSAPIIRKQVLEEIRFWNEVNGELEDCYFDPNLLRSEDIECWLRIAIQTPWKIEGIPEALTYYRLNSSATSLSSSILKHLQDFEKMVEKTRLYAPEFIAKWENPCRAYQLRYLARRAVQMQDRELAIALTNRALATHWQILLHEPRRTVLTIAAAYLLWSAPPALYRALESLGFQMTGAMQKRQIRRDTRGNLWNH
jgi:glycosyltransferase involved in cell wall biosynthesis